MTFHNFQENVASTVQCTVLTSDPDNLSITVTIGTDIVIQSLENDISTGDTDPGTGSVYVTFRTNVTLKRMHCGKYAKCHFICAGTVKVSSEPHPVTVLCKLIFCDLF